jgi:hypothetical protein
MDAVLKFALTFLLEELIDRDKHSAAALKARWFLKALNSPAYEEMKKREEKQNIPVAGNLPPFEIKAGEQVKTVTPLGGTGGPPMPSGDTAEGTGEPL